MTGDIDDWVICSRCGEAYRPPPHRCPYCTRKAGPQKPPPVGHVEEAPPMPTSAMARDAVEKGVRAIFREGQRHGWARGYPAGYAAGASTLSRPWFLAVLALTAGAGVVGGLYLAGALG